MTRRFNRRDFVRTGAAGLAAAAATPRTLFGQGSTMMTPRSVKPLVVSSANGHRYRNGGTKTCIETAYEAIVKGEDVLDAVIAGVNIVELDPEETSVGYGGLPNADGVVQLDSCCMHGPRKQAGGVACLEGVRTPSRVAKAVMEQTDHLLLVGKGAQDFAREVGFTIEADLNTPRSRRLWLEWKRRTDPEHYLDPKKREEIERKVMREMVAEGLVDRNHIYGTINCNGIGPAGEICGVTTTSGWAWKIPGRAGDSPILGAGLYVDGEVGAAGSTGRGEANLYNLCSFMIVEGCGAAAPRRTPAWRRCRRVQANTVEKRPCSTPAAAQLQVNFYILDARGEHAGVGMYGGPRVTTRSATEHGAETRPCEALFDEELTLRPVT